MSTRTNKLSMPKSVAKLETKAAKIRALWTMGYSRGQIVKMLGGGISFQHVYNTTQRPTKGYDPDAVAEARKAKKAK